MKVEEESTQIGEVAMFAETPRASSDHLHDCPVGSHEWLGFKRKLTELKPGL